MKQKWSERVSLINTLPLIVLFDKFIPLEISKFIILKLIL